MKGQISLNLAPNPAENFVNIKVNLQQPLDYLTISLFSADGKLLDSFNQENLIAGDNSIPYNTENYNAGFYFIQIEGENTMMMKKLSIK